MSFLFGTPRSGTILLAQCLSAHTKIIVPSETDFIGFWLYRIKLESYRLNT